jgi:hypothetical protein
MFDMTIVIDYVAKIVAAAGLPVDSSFWKGPALARVMSAGDEVNLFVEKLKLDASRAIMSATSAPRFGDFIDGVHTSFNQQLRLTTVRDQFFGLTRVLSAMHSSTHIRAPHYYVGPDTTRDACAHIVGGPSPAPAIFHQGGGGYGCQHWWLAAER